MLRKSVTTVWKFLVKFLIYSVWIVRIFYALKISRKVAFSSHDFIFLTSWIYCLGVLYLTRIGCENRDSKIFPRGLAINSKQFFLMGYKLLTWIINNKFNYLSYFPPMQFSFIKFKRKLCWTCTTYFDLQYDCHTVKH